MPNYSPHITTKFAKVKDILMKVVKDEPGKQVCVEANQVVKFDDQWAEMVKDRPIIIINNQKVDIRISMIYEAIRLIDDIDIALYREAILKGEGSK